MVGGFVKSGGEMWQNSEIECQTILKPGINPSKCSYFQTMYLGSQFGSMRIETLEDFIDVQQMS